jgi:adenine phosphoribosyltransferase
MEMVGARLRDLIREVADFPRPGVAFKDITPLLADPHGFAMCTDALADHFSDQGVDKVIGIEARGFIIAAPVAYRLGAGFVPVRKKGKLPSAVYSDTYDLEYGTDTLEVHLDSLQPGRLVDRLGAVTVGFGCVLELGFLQGRQKLPGLVIEALVGC